MEYVYFINQEGSNYVKIGFTKEHPIKRLAALQTSNPNKLNIIGAIETEKSVETEKEYHQMFKKYRVSGEWFLLNKTDIEIIKAKYPLKDVDGYFKLCKEIYDKIGDEKKAISFLKKAYEREFLNFKEDTSIESILINKYVKHDNYSFLTTTDVVNNLKTKTNKKISLKKTGMLLKKYFIRTRSGSVYGYKISILN